MNDSNLTLQRTSPLGEESSESQKGTTTNSTTSDAERQKQRSGLISKYNIEFREIPRKQYDNVSKQYVERVSTQVWSNNRLIAEYETTNQKLNWN